MPVVAAPGDMSVAGDFAVGVSATPGAVVVALSGELDAFSAPRLREALRAVDGRADLVVDAAGLTFIDSTGLGVLAAAAKRLSAVGRTVAVRGAGPSIFRVLEITRLIDVLDVEPCHKPGDDNGRDTE